MIRVTLRGGGPPAAPARTRRQRFGLDAPLPADPHIVERAILRHLAEAYPDLMVLALTRPNGSAPDAASPTRVDVAAGVPDLLLVRPGGGLVFLAVRAQAHRPTRAERAFADLCRVRAVPFHIVRTLPETQRVLDHLGLAAFQETHHAGKEGDLARRPS